MALLIAILKESQRGERRVAPTPAIVSRLKRPGVDICIEESAGRSATFEDTAYTDCRIGAGKQTLPKTADIVLAVQPPSIGSVEAMSPGTMPLSFVHGGNSPDLMRVLRDRTRRSSA